ncbi:hypothetical protein Desdi_1139 [Desulfitobacterium dichloroeliminans LMG P-21439]|uniref:DUF2933 domain-containing protein n=1 Tax=Desulfitobacterium dichloroeliminans (strain LMG P-21439 / DCA1) TaxID=871963 RepID=L0F4A0_DESDL|nr:hypothetical protein Desdi_1139 [Desulfitobacterium dichloroeliminans LMG P-21439]
MKCCDNEKSNVDESGNETDCQHEKKHKGFFSHMWMMVLCCGLPIAIILLIPLMGGFLSPGIRIALLSFAPFLCMLLMIPMMFMMMRGHKEKG